jgi:dipeptidyl-peptidase-4
MNRIYLPFAAVLLAITHCLAQGPASISRDDYRRAVGFLWQNVNNKKAFNVSVRPNWFADSTGFWYLFHSRDAKTFMKVTFSKLKAEPLFDHDRLGAAIGDHLNEKIDPKQLPFNVIEFLGKDHIRFAFKDRSYDVDLKTYTISRKKEDEKLAWNESKSPDGKWLAYIENYNLYVKSLDSGKVRQLSTAGRRNFEYGSYYGWGDLIEGENGDRPRHFRVSWSPDSKWLQTFICDLRYPQKMYLLDWSVDTLYRARLLSYYRGSPGDTTMVYMIPLVYNIASGKEVATGLPRSTHTNPVSFTWSKTPGYLFAEYFERGYQNYHVAMVDLKAEKTQPLLHEKSKTNIDNFDWWRAEKAGKLIYASEKSGWRQLYTFNLKDHTLSPIAPGEYFVDDVRRVDEKSRSIFFIASGREAGRNPYHQHLYKASIDKKDLVLLTPENLHHEIELSPDGEYFFDNMSSAQQPTQSVLRDSKSGKIVLEISKTDVKDLTSMKWAPAETFVVKGRDGKTQLYGAMWKPSNFDASKRYPVIDQSYTGPHTQMFPRTFQRTLQVNNQPLAELGFIVITVDGMGTAGRSKAFHDVSYKHMGLNLTDHVLAIKQLSERFPWIDLERVGIFGHSAGGYDAGHALLQFPDFYKVGVASSGDHDFRMEKDWWPEMYMGWPVDTAYHNQSNITMAGRLKGKLLLVHGGLDENVNPSATFKLAEALVKADKEFDMLILPSQHHGYVGKYGEYFTKRRWNYFVQHLLGAKPIWDFAFE